jgi:hypothetical protein
MEAYQYQILQIQKEIQREMGQFLKIFIMFSDHFSKKSTGMSKRTIVLS